VQDRKHIKARTVSSAKNSPVRVTVAIDNGIIIQYKRAHAVSSAKNPPARATVAIHGDCCVYNAY